MKRPNTPGEILKKEFMDTFGLTAQTLSTKANISPSIISRLLNNKTTITTPVAIKLGKLFGTTTDYWLTLQIDVDKHDLYLDTEFQKELDKIERIG